MAFNNSVHIQPLYMEIIMELFIAFNLPSVRIVSLLIDHFIMELSLKTIQVMSRLLAEIHFEKPMVKIGLAIIQLFAKNCHFTKENQINKDQIIIDNFQDKSITIIMV